ncbi:MAG: hypothetical protein NTY99_01350 [DPANN group archaeon]|nr:hypothetical protein [DPANN group archaeon]
MDKDLELLLKVPEIKYDVINHTKKLDDKGKVQYLTMLLGANPKDQKIAYALADTLVKLEDYVGALDISAQYLNEDDKKTIATKICVSKAETLWSERKYTDALGELMNIPDKEGVDTAALRLVRKYLPKVKATANELKQFFNILPDFYKDLLTIKTAEQVESFMSKGMFTDAINSIAAVESYPKLYEDSLTGLLRRVDDNSALKIYDLLVEKSAINKAENSYAKAQLLETMERFDEAIQAYKDSEKHGGRLDTRLKVADLLFKKGDFEKALEMYTSIISNPYHYGLTSVENAKSMKILTLKALGRPEKEEQKKEEKHEKKGFFGKKKR